MTPTKDQQAQEYAEKHFLQDVQIFFNKPYDKAKERYAKTLADFAKYCMAHQWISIDERLPEEYRTVLAYIDNDDFRELKIVLAHWDGEDWYDTGDHKVRPSHWMYIPELNPEKEVR